MIPTYMRCARLRTRLADVTQLYTMPTHDRGLRARREGYHLQPRYDHTMTREGRQVHAAVAVQCQVLRYTPSAAVCWSIACRRALDASFQRAHLSCSPCPRLRSANCQAFAQDGSEKVRPGRGRPRGQSLCVVPRLARAYENKHACSSAHELPRHHFPFHLPGQQLHVSVRFASNDISNPDNSGSCERDGEAATRPGACFPRLRLRARRWRRTRAVGGLARWPSPPLAHRWRELHPRTVRRCAASVDNSACIFAFLARRCCCPG